MADSLHIAAISGSLRRGSFNTAALRAAAELAPAGMRVEVLTLHGVPLYDGDVEAQGIPEAVGALGAKVRAADGVLFAMPEYNYSVAGVLKNGIDWLSRPPAEAPLRGKPVAILGATPSMVGTARGQAHLRDIVYYNAMPLLTSAEVLIANAQERFDDQGRLVHADTRAVLAKFLEAFRDWIVRLRI